MSIGYYESNETIYGFEFRHISKTTAQNSKQIHNPPHSVLHSRRKRYFQCATSFFFPHYSCSTIESVVFFSFILTNEAVGVRLLNTIYPQSVSQPNAYIHTDSPNRPASHYDIYAQSKHYNEVTCIPNTLWQTHVMECVFRYSTEPMNEHYHNRMLWSNLIREFESLSLYLCLCLDDFALTFFVSLFLSNQCSTEGTLCMMIMCLILCHWGF